MPITEEVKSFPAAKVRLVTTKGSYDSTLIRLLTSHELLQHQKILLIV